MTKELETLNKDEIKQVTGGWGPTQVIKENDDGTISIILQWKFSQDEVNKLRKHKYKVCKDKEGYTLMDDLGLPCFYDYPTDKDRIEEILGKEETKKIIF